MHSARGLIKTSVDSGNNRSIFNTTGNTNFLQKKKIGICIYMDTALFQAGCHLQVTKLTVKYYSKKGRH